MNIRGYLRHLESIGLLKPVPTGEVKYALDLGCGTGVDSIYLASLGFVVTSVDKKNIYPGTINEDIRTFNIETAKFDIIICNNVLPFIPDKNEVFEITRKIIRGLKKGAPATLTYYGKNHNAVKKHQLSIFEYPEILSFIETLPVEIIDKTMSEGYVPNIKQDVVYQHSFRFILKAI